MRIEPIEPKQTSFKNITIKAKDNKDVKFLYNKASDIVKENKIPAVFNRDTIELSTDKKSVMEQLKELGIKFINGKKGNK